MPQIINGVGRAGVRVTTATPQVSYDTDAQAFITAAALTDTTQKNAINDLVLDLKGAGIWTKMKALYPMIGGTATTHKFNLKDPRDLDAAYRLTFAGGWTHSSTGALPNGTTGYADTFLVPTAMGQDSIHGSSYLRTNTTSNGPAFSSEQASTYNNGFYLWPKQVTSNNYSVRINDSTSQQLPNGDIRGLNLISRTASNSKKYRINTTEVFSVTTASTGRNTDSIYIGKSRNNANFYTNEYSLLSFGDGLTDLESNLFYQIVEKYQYALGRNVNANQSFYFNRNYSNETNAFIFNGAISNATQQSAINTLVNDLKAAGIWTKMKAVYPMVGGTALAHKFNLANPVDTDAAFRLTFNGGGTHDANGYQTNGSNALADTYLTPSTTLTLNSTHISVYSRTNSAGTYSDLGTQDVTSRAIGMFIRGADNSVITRINEGFNPSVGTNTDSRGFYIGSRTASNVRKTYINSTLFNTNSTASVALPTSKIGIGANFYNNTVANSNYFSNRQYAFASIGDGLTDLESNLFYQIVEKFQYTLGRNINTAQPFYYNSSYTNETNAFIFNGAVTDATQISAVNTLVTTLKTAGIWTKMKAVYPMVGGTALAHKFNLVNPVDAASTYALTFAGGWTHSSTGALPNGTTGYADTFLTPSTALTLYNNHISFYSRTNTNVGGNNDIGAYYQTTSPSAAYTCYQYNGRNSDGNAVGSISSDDPYRVIYSQTKPNSFVVTSRTANNSLKMYQDGVLKGTSTTVNTSVFNGLPPTPINLGALPMLINGSLSRAGYSNKQCAFASIGDGLTDAEATTFYNAVQAFQTTLGRQV